MKLIYKDREYYIEDERCYGDFFKIVSRSLLNPADTKDETEWLLFKQCQNLLLDDNWIESRI